MEKRSMATLRDRGQLTIPADVRKQAQLEEGAVVEFEVREEGLLLRPRLCSTTSSSTKASSKA